MKTYKEFKEAAALVLPALKAAPYVIPALGAGANILKGMMKSDASDKFKARQRGGRLTPGEVQRRQAREDRRTEAQRRARENTPVSKPNTENVPTAKKPAREKVDPRLERAANQVIDRLRDIRRSLPEGYKDPLKRELKLKGQQIINDKEKYDKITTPVRVKKA